MTTESSATPTASFCAGCGGFSNDALCATCGFDPESAAGNELVPCPHCAATIPTGTAYCPQCAGLLNKRLVRRSGPAKTYGTGIAFQSAPAPPPGWQSPYAHSPYMQPMSRGTNGLAIASMVLGIVWVYWIGSILAVIFGHIALGQIDRTGQHGRGMAVAGLVLGYIGVGILVLLILALIIG